MLKQYLALLCILFLLCTGVRVRNPLAENETPVPSAITSATVFLKGAQVNRAATRWWTSMGNHSSGPCCR